MTKFKVGDRVRIRAWEDMAKEFGIAAEGYIKLKEAFTLRMLPLCGRCATVADTLNSYILLTKLDGDTADAEPFFLTEDMLEPADVREKD